MFFRVPAIYGKNQRPAALSEALRFDKRCERKYTEFYHYQENGQCLKEKRSALFLKMYRKLDPNRSSGMALSDCGGGLWRFGSSGKILFSKRDSGKEKMANRHGVFPYRFLKGVGG